MGILAKTFVCSPNEHCHETSPRLHLPSHRWVKFEPFAGDDDKGAAGEEGFAGAREVT
jgi:hypothetical protein